MNVADINVVGEKQFQVYQQTIKPSNIDELLEYMRAMDAEIRRTKFTGKMTINFNQGGTRSVVTEQVADIIHDEVVGDSEKAA